MQGVALAVQMTQAQANGIEIVGVRRQHEDVQRPGEDQVPQRTRTTAGKEKGIEFIHSQSPPNRSLNFFAASGSALDFIGVPLGYSCAIRSSQ